MLLHRIWVTLLSTTALALPLPSPQPTPNPILHPRQADQPPAPTTPNQPGRPPPEIAPGAPPRAPGPRTPRTPHQSASPPAPASPPALPAPDLSSLSSLSDNDPDTAPSSPFSSSSSPSSSSSSSSSSSQNNPNSPTHPFTYNLLPSHIRFPIPYTTAHQIFQTIRAEINHRVDIIPNANIAGVRWNVPNVQQQLGAQHILFHALRIGGAAFSWSELAVVFEVFEAVFLGGGEEGGGTHPGVGAGSVDFGKQLVATRRAGGEPVAFLFWEQDFLSAFLEELGDGATGAAGPEE